MLDRGWKVGSAEMGKNGKKQGHQHKPSRQRVSRISRQEDDFDESERYPLSPSSPTSSSHSNGEDDKGKEGDDSQQEVQERQEQKKNYQNSSIDNLVRSKFSLYQQSVQSPKGDISYLLKFFLLYVGGRAPLHLQEDFCGTALLSSEWLRTDPRRTAVGVDLDLEALIWCVENNINRIGVDISSRLSLFHGNVLQPHDAKLVNSSPEALIKNGLAQEGDDSKLEAPAEPSLHLDHGMSKEEFPLVARDIICAFNYSCCCLHKRKELVSYFKHSLDALSNKGGIFVMDLYGGTSSECELRLQRKFPNFTYIWEQEEFDIIQRKTRISLHFHLQKPQKKIRHAFSYNWRLWSLPEIRDCLEEAGFRSIHFWMREMPDSSEMRKTDGFGASKDVKYVEVSSFQQQDAWNAYVVAVA